MTMPSDRDARAPPEEQAMRDWCLVIDAVSAEAADRIGLALRDQQRDLEVEDPEARVGPLRQRTACSAGNAPMAADPRAPAL